MFKAESQVVWDDDLTPDPPTSASQVLGSSVGTTMPGFEDFFFLFFKSKGISHQFGVGLICSLQSHHTAFVMSH